MRRPIKERIHERSKNFHCREEVDIEKIMIEKEKTAHDSWVNLFKKIKNIGSILPNEIEIRKTETFFKDVLTFEKNKIHFIRGDNGQGKSSLLRNIADSTMMGVLSNFDKRNLKIGSPNKSIGATINEYMFSPYRGHGTFDDTKKGLTNLKNSITLYTDFTIEFFRESDNGMSIININQEFERHSNGERKISGINDVLGILKIANELEEGKGLSFIIVMDEPESGLSSNLVEEFQQRMVYYMDALTNKGMDVTFFIASHQPSLILSPFILTHSVNSFKKKRRSKSKHTKVFI